MSRVILTDSVGRHTSMKIRQFFGFIFGIGLIIIGIVAFFESKTIQNDSDSGLTLFFSIIFIFIGLSILLVLYILKKFTKKNYRY